MTVSSVVKIDVINELGNNATYYLPLLEQIKGQNNQDKLLPFLLGTGRNAVVFLAWTKANEQESDFLAFKFLKDDPKNQEYAQMVKDRFLIELNATKHASFRRGFFVKFRGHGILGNFDLKNKKNAEWRELFPKDWANDKNSTPYHNEIQQYFDLQGPFYILELCQGSLHDLLERGEPWLFASKSYQQVSLYKEALKDQYSNIREKVKKFKSDYIEEEGHNGERSGYGILNSFKDNLEANKVRNYAILQLFLEVASKVQNLHALGLVHRDLKLGNIFLKHDADPVGFDHISFKLADLGYAASITPLQKGEWTLEVDNWRTPGALVPGSQYYRAPEQAKLPIEVRIDIDKDDPTKVVIKSSKITEIEKGDQLVVGDYFGEGEGSTFDKNIKRVFDVHINGDSYYLTLEDALDLQTREDLQAHIIKSTGYHTDGFSLGAILYDLVSGGKNPEDFYTYNLARFYKSTTASRYSVNQIVESFFPSKHVENQLRLRIKEIERERIPGREEPRSRNVIKTIERILLSNSRTTTSDEFSNEQFQEDELLVEIMDILNINRLENELLEDIRGVKIPEEILRIIVKSMVRDVKDERDATDDAKEESYYHSAPQEGFFTEENGKAATKLVNDVKRILNGFERGTDIPYELKDNLLIKLRMFWHEPESSKTLSQPSKALEGNEASKTSHDILEFENNVAVANEEEE